jgi:protein-disulfide isomerase
VLEAYPRDVKLVFKHFPLSFHANARPAAEAAAFAHKHGKFWEMHDLIFKNPRALTIEAFKGYGQQLGLDPQALETSVRSQSFKSVIDKDMADGQKANVTGTPSIYVNGKKLPRRDFATFKQVIDEILAGKGAAAASGR